MTMTINYKLTRWRWWVAPLVTVGCWSRSDLFAGWIVRLVLARGRYIEKVPT